MKPSSRELGFLFIFTSFDIDKKCGGGIYANIFTFWLQRTAVDANVCIAHGRPRQGAAKRFAKKRKKNYAPIFNM